MHTGCIIAYPGTFPFQSKRCLWTRGIGDKHHGKFFGKFTWDLILMLMVMAMLVVTVQEIFSNKLSLEKTLINYQWLYLFLLCSYLETKKMVTLRNEEPPPTWIAKIEITKTKKTKLTINVMNIHLPIICMQVWWIYNVSLSRWQW